MATILRGKRKGQEIKIHQSCNDWVTDEDNNVYRVTGLKFTEEEFAKVLKDVASYLEPDHEKLIFKPRKVNKVKLTKGIITHLKEDYEKHPEKYTYPSADFLEVLKVIKFDSSPLT
jgi:hypothetical protein